MIICSYTIKLYDIYYKLYNYIHIYTVYYMIIYSYTIKLYDVHCIYYDYM